MTTARKISREEFMDACAALWSGTNHVAGSSAGTGLPE